jgi:hypothetical protein
VSAAAIDPQFLLPRRLDGTDLPGRQDDRFYPPVEPDGNVRLLAGETVLWRGQVCVGEFLFTQEFDDFDRLWDLPEPADVVVTSERVAFLCARWTAGGGWRSHGMAPITTMALNAASKMRAAARRRGVVIVGQCRWEWPAIIQLRPGVLSGDRLHRAEPPAILLGCRAGSGEGWHTLKLSGPGLATLAAIDSAGNTILQALISYRLTHAEILGLEQRELELLSGLAAERAFTVADSGEGQGLRLPAALPIGFMSRSAYDSADMDRLIDKHEADHGNQ